MKPFTSPMSKPNFGSKPAFSIKPKMGPPTQTPIKYDNGGYRDSNNDEMNAQSAEQNYAAGLASQTPPPGPSQSRVQGTK